MTMANQDPDQIKSTLRRFMLQNYLGNSASQTFSDNDSFLEKGILDSIGVIELVAFIQQRFGITIKVQEILPENFDSINGIYRYLGSKQRTEKGR